MKFTPEVLTALAVLREHAENDFERHRIDVLERDLTNPPTVEIIDENHQKFNGVIYGRNIQNRYTCSGSIHRAVWAYYNGAIPIGCEIHHLDTNKHNNAIGNLQCLTQSEHRALHAPHGDPLPKEKKEFICEICGKPYKAFATGNNRFCSEKCHNKFYHSIAPKHKRTCEQCGEEFFATTGKARFCSRSCIGAARRATSQITKICPICGKSFRVKKSSNQKCCSKKCMYKSLSQQFTKTKQ